MGSCNRCHLIAFQRKHKKRAVKLQFQPTEQNPDEEQWGVLDPEGEYLSIDGRPASLAFQPLSAKRHTNDNDCWLGHLEPRDE